MFTLRQWLRAWHRAPLVLLVPRARCLVAACTPAPCPLRAPRAVSRGRLLHTCRCRGSGVGSSTAVAAPVCHGGVDKQQLCLNGASGRKD